MQIDIKIKDRNLAFSSGTSSGESLKELILFIGKNSVHKLIISGESKSYTLLRQVALFANLLFETGQTRIVSRSKSFDLQKDRLFPKYSN